MPTSLVNFRGKCNTVIVHTGISLICNCMEWLSVGSRASRGQEVCSQHLHSVYNKGRALLSLRYELSVSQVAKECITAQISCWGIDRCQAVALTSKLTFNLNFYLLLLIFHTQLLIEQKQTTTTTTKNPPTTKKKPNQNQKVLLLVQQQHYVCWQPRSVLTQHCALKKQQRRFSWGHRARADAGG